MLIEKINKRVYYYADKQNPLTNIVKNPFENDYYNFNPVLFLYRYKMIDFVPEYVNNIQTRENFDFVTKNQYRQQNIDIYWSGKMFLKSVF